MDLSLFDLSKDADSGFKMTVVDPKTNEPTDASIYVIGSDSKVYRSAKAKIYRKAAREDVDADELSAEVYSNCITGWSGLQDKGEDIEFNHEAALNLLNRLPWLMDQVSFAVETRSNFTKKPAKN